MADKPTLKLLRMIGITPVMHYGSTCRQVYYEVVLNNVTIASTGFKIGYNDPINDDLDPAEALDLIDNLETALDITAERDEVRIQPH